jgi:hypothetical protein
MLESVRSNILSKDGVRQIRREFLPPSDGELQSSESRMLRFFIEMKSQNEFIEFERWLLRRLKDDFRTS